MTVNNARVCAKLEGLIDAHADHWRVAQGAGPDLARLLANDVVDIGGTLATWTGQTIASRVEDYRQLGQHPHLFTDNVAVPREDRLPHALGKQPAPAPEVVARAKQVQDPRKRLAVINGHDPAAALNKHSHLNKVWVK